MSAFKPMQDAVPHGHPRPRMPGFHAASDVQTCLAEGPDRPVYLFVREAFLGHSRWGSVKLFLPPARLAVHWPGGRGCGSEALILELA